MACVKSFPPRTPEECRAIINEVDMINPVLALMLEFSARTGLRVGDTGNLRFKDLYINGVLRDSITVIQSKAFNKRVTSGINSAMAKRQALVTITINNKTREEILAELDQKALVDTELTTKERDQIVAEARKASAVTIGINEKTKELVEDALRLSGGNMGGLVFESSIKKGSPYSTQYINRILKVVAFKLKLNFPLSTHSFRKAFALFITENDARMYQVRDALGHSSLDVTDAYLKSFMSEHKEIAAKVDF